MHIHNQKEKENKILLEIKSTDKKLEKKNSFKFYSEREGSDPQQPFQKPVLKQAIEPGNDFHPLKEARLSLYTIAKSTLHIEKLCANMPCYHKLGTAMLFLQNQHNVNSKEV